MMKRSKALSAGIWYTVGNIFIKGINFLTVPIFSRLLTTEEFGVYNMFIAYDSILCIIISLALYMSLQSAKLEFKNQIDQYTSCITLVYIAISILFLGGIFLFGDWITTVLDLPQIVLYMLVLYSFGSGIIVLYNQRISLDYDYKRYLVIAFLNSIGNIVLSLILILTIFREQKDIGRIIGVTISMVGISIVILLVLYRKAKPKLKMKYIIFGVRYSIPIVPHGISQVLLSQFDRIMISKLVNNTATGIYSLAGYIKLILTIITESISSVWRTWFYDRIVLNEIKNIQNKASMLVSAFSVLSMGMMALSPELIMFLGGKEYIMGQYVAIPMIADAFVIFLYNIVVPAEYYKKKTNYIMFGTLFAAILNIITNYIFILKFGYIAAAYTTLFAYMCYLIMHVTISKKLIGFFIIPLKELVGFSALFFVDCVLTIIFINSIWIRLIVGGGCIIFMSMEVLKKYKENNRLNEKSNSL